MSLKKTIDMEQSLKFYDKNTMRKFFFLLLTLSTHWIVSAQDKIITVSGDTILCRIVSISSNHIVYEQQTDKKNISGKLILLSDVAEYFRETDTQLLSENRSSRTPQKPWLLGLSIGGGHLPWLLENASMESAGNDDYKKLDDGFALNANAHYLITQNIGLGVQYSFFTSGIKNDDFTMIDQTYPIYLNSTNRERQYINYAGISIIFRQFLDRNHKFSLNETLGGGILFYRNESQNSIFLPNSSGYGGYGGYSDFSQNILMTGNTFGFSGGISADYKVLPFVSVGIGGNFMYGKLTNASGEFKNSYGNSSNFTNEKLNNPLKLSRIDYSFVIRFHL